MPSVPGAHFQRAPSDSGPRSVLCAVVCSSVHLELSEHLLWALSSLYLCCTRSLGPREPALVVCPRVPCSHPSEVLSYLSMPLGGCESLARKPLPSTCFSLVWRKSLPFSSGPSGPSLAPHFSHEPNHMNQKSPCPATCFPAADVPSVRPPTGYEQPTGRTDVSWFSGNCLAIHFRVRRALVSLSSSRQFCPLGKC